MSTFKIYLSTILFIVLLGSAKFIDNYYPIPSTNSVVKKTVLNDIDSGINHKKKPPNCFGGFDEKQKTMALVFVSINPNMPLFFDYFLPSILSFKSDNAEISPKVVFSLLSFIFLTAFLVSSRSAFLASLSAVLAFSFSSS